ncbi:MAG: hypothetical protein KGJ90_04715 [Patescibacteria group bacterium]|nr:hypothetical protein [Patescibacteria group bacterium]
MPTTKHGAKVLRNLRKEYGAKKAKRVYYALQVEGKGGKGKHKWEGPGGTGKLKKAEKTYAMKHRKKAAKTLEKAYS